MLHNKVVLITGSTAGIGAASARECVEQGAKVMIHGRDETRARQLCEELGPNVAYCIKPLRDHDAADYLVQQTVKQFGRLDVLVNNAGIFPRNKIHSINNENYDLIMTVNLRTPLFLCQKAIEVFRTQPTKGVIVNIGSINAHTGQDDLLIYSISKGGLMTLTRNLGNALAAEGIRVNLLNVGWTVTQTELDLKRSEGLPEDWESHVPEMFAPRGYLMRPEEIAHHVVFWACDRSAPVSGQVYSCEQYPADGRVLINVVQDYFRP